MNTNRLAALALSMGLTVHQTTFLPATIRQAAGKLGLDPERFLTDHVEPCREMRLYLRDVIVRAEATLAQQEAAA